METNGQEAAATITEIPAWCFDLGTFACPDCLADDKLVAIQITEGRLEEFRKNRVMVKCPECGYDRPQMRQVVDKKTRKIQYEETCWTPIYYSSLHYQLLSKKVKLVKEPEEFADSLHTRYIQVPHGTA